MIRKVVEYMIVCDYGDRCVDGFGHATAFGSPTKQDCEEQARQHDGSPSWRIVARL